MKKTLLIIFILLVGIKVFSQTNQDDDSTIVQQQTIDLIQKADSLNVSDSLQKAFLIQQLENLKSNEIQKRKEIEAQLLELQILDSARKAETQREIDSLKKIAKAYPIVPHKDTLFFVYTKAGSFTPGERAEIINERLKDAYKQYISKIDSLEIIDYGQSVDIIFKDKPLITITDYDEMWIGKPKLQIAQEYKSLIENDIVIYKQNKSFLKLIKQIGLVILIIVIQVLLIKLINYLFKNKIDKYIVNQKGKKLKGIKLGDYQFLDEERLSNVALFISKVLRWIINLLQLYITIPALFSIFPPTKRLAETLFSYILNPLKKIGLNIVHYLPNLFMIIVIVIITRYVIKFIKFLSSEVEEGNLKLKGFYPDWAKPTFNIVRFLVLAFMFVMIFPYLPGSNSPVFKGVSVFIGVVFSLGSTSIIGNLVSGLVMTYMRPFQIGDRIKIGDVVGDVVERTPFVTRIKTPKKEFITIPNSNILSSNVVNYSTSKTEGIILHTTVTIGYDVPWRTVHSLLINAAEKTKHIIEKPEPFVLQTSLDDFYVSYQLNAYSNEPNMQPAIYSELHQHIQDEFNKAGVEILSPHYRGQRDGNHITIPEEYLPKEYKAPPFNFKQM